jgi:peroxiredoxin
MKHNLKKMISVATSAAFVMLMMTSATAPKPATGYRAGDKAMDFNLKNIDGNMMSLASDRLATKGAIIIFTCNHCPFSVAYEDRIIALNNKYQAQGYPVIAINPNDPALEEKDSYENMQKRAKDKGFNFPYLIDESQQITRAYGASRTPHVFVVQKEGTGFTVKYVGSIDDNKDEPAAVKHKYVEKAVDELIAGKPVTENFTKAIGCGIKWRKAN